MEGKVFHIDGMGKLLSVLRDGYESEKYRAVVVMAITKDGLVEVGWSGKMTYLEGLGLFEVAKYDVALRAMVDGCRRG